MIGALDLAAPSHLIMMDDVDRTRLGDSRKLNNLRTYLERAHARFPSAVIRSVILTNAPDGTEMRQLADRLGSELTT